MRIQGPARRCFGGLCVAVVASRHGVAGEIVLRARAEGLEAASVALAAR